MGFWTSAALMTMAAATTYEVTAGAHQAKKGAKSARTAADARAQELKKQMEAAPAEAAEKARLETLKRRKVRSKTILTSPSGLLESETLGRKTLLGE